MGDFISYKLLPTVCNMSVTASVAILLVLLARLLLKNAPKIFSYALWAVVLFRLLCPVSISTDFSLLGLFDAPATEATTHTTVLEYIPQDVVHTPNPEVRFPVSGVNQAINEVLPQGEEQTGADPLEAPVALSSLIWLAGILVLIAYSLVSLLRLRRSLVGSILLQDNIYLADYIQSPFVLGLFHPKIYLPSSLPQREQNYIILHEQHHIRRGDHIVKCLAFLALCIHWFNPLVWLAFSLSSRDMEMSCDEAVVKKLGDSIRADYSASLLSLATGRRIIAGTPLAFGEGDTKSRIKNLLNWKQPKLWITVLAAIICVAATAACAGNPPMEVFSADTQTDVQNKSGQTSDNTQSDIQSENEQTSDDTQSDIQSDDERISTQTQPDEQSESTQTSVQTQMTTLYDNGEITISIPSEFADLIRVDNIGSDNAFVIKANLYFLPEYVENDDVTPTLNGGWMLSVATTLPSFAESIVGQPSEGMSCGCWTADGQSVYVENRPLDGFYKCGESNLEKYKTVMESIRIDYGNLPPYTG